MMMTPPYYGAVDDPARPLRPGLTIYNRAYSTDMSTFNPGLYTVAIALAHCVPALSLAEGMLAKIKGIDANWGEIGSEPPNAASKRLTVKVLDRTFLMGRKAPSYLTASAEGGVGIVFKSDARYAAIECLNDETMWLLWYDENGSPQSREVIDSPGEIDKALQFVAFVHQDA